MDKTKIRMGMAVHSADDHDLGRVEICGENNFVIGSGLVLLKEYTLPYSEAASIDQNGCLVLSRTYSDLKQIPPGTFGRVSEAAVVSDHLLRQGDTATQASSKVQSGVLTIVDEVEVIVVGRGKNAA